MSVTRNLNPTLLIVYVTDLLCDMLLLLPRSWCNISTILTVARTFYSCELHVLKFTHNSEYTSIYSH